MSEAKPLLPRVVLLVDDEPDNLSMLARSLRRDVRVLTAASAEDARTILATQPVDVVVSDERLPGESGSALLRFVSQTNPRIGRMLITAYGDAQSVVNATRHGVAERFFLKPFTAEALKSAVYDLLRSRGLAERPRVLVADDDSQVRELVATFLGHAGLDVHEAPGGEQAIAALKANEFDAAVLDINMPRVSGLEVFKEAAKLDPPLPVVFLSGEDPGLGASLFAAGAFDYVSKPVRAPQLVMRVERAVVAMRQAREHRRLVNELAASRQANKVIGTSPALRRTIEVARNLARHDITVLVTGETGSGKEVLARFIHEVSRRASGPFIPVNCGAIPEQLVESTLFGHERGAFTDAKERRVGIFEAASGGTVFLDEVGELSLASQTRLLRVLESHEITRVGAVNAVKVDIRVIAATHRDLEEMVEARTFRQDLFFRLSAVILRVPPLRERPEDIPLLIESALASFAARNNVSVPRISSAALEQALAHRWPGNVRELLHVVDRTLITTGGEVIERFDFGGGAASAAAVTAPAAGPSLALDDSRPLKDALAQITEELERRYLEQVLARVDGHIGRAADHAGIHRKSLYNKMRRYGLSAKGRA